ncbi:MAG: aldo/keto reductase [Candidatus Aminicenantes bacterium]|nr:aldo/keto reductase [Candidatus Aminicenantes bacterium]
MSQKSPIDRRHFLKKSTLGMIGAGMAAKTAFPEAFQEETQTPPKIKEYRTLGRTGFKVSDISLGYTNDEGIIGTALDAGMNYIDTAEQYPGHHRVVASVMKGRNRKEVFITTKLQVLEDTTKEGFLKRARKCLEELEMDYVDCIMMHCPEKAVTIKTEGFHAAMLELKAEGRVKYVGASQHGSFWYEDSEETMDKVLLAAADDGRFDVFLLAYNFLKLDQGERVLQVCKEKKIGSVLMKSTPTAIFYSMKASIESMKEKGTEISEFRANGLKRYQEKMDRAETFIQKYNLKNPQEIQGAAIRFVLDNPNVNSVCLPPKTYDELDRFISLSGSSLDDLDKARLAQYKEGCGELYCRHACGVCEPQCPHGVPVNTIMRYFRYFAAQGREKEAMLNYAAIPGFKADVCSNCPGHCESACPHNVPVQGMLILANNQLSL